MPESERRLHLVQNDPTAESEPAQTPVWGSENIDRIVGIVEAYDESDQAHAPHDGPLHALTKIGRKIVDRATEALKW